MHNPLDDSDEAYQQRVRDRAYHLWQSEGEPHGRDGEYWERARELIGMEESGNSGQLPNPGTEPTTPAGEPVEEAVLQENLGEFPDRSSDQGEHAQSPSLKRKRAAARSQPVGTTSAGEAPITPDEQQGAASTAKPKRKAAGKAKSDS